MNKRFAVILFLVCLMVPFVVTFESAKAASHTIIVPDNYRSITAAISNAANGDVIYVKKGVYNESTLDINKALTIRGEDVRNTIVNLNPPVVVYKYDFPGLQNRESSVPSVGIKMSADNVKISGFTILSTGGIYGYGDGIEITSNIISAGMSNFPINNTVTIDWLATSSLTGSNMTIARNTLTGNFWRINGARLTLAENMINASFNGVEVSSGYCNISGNNVIGDLSVVGSYGTITHNSYDILSLGTGDSNTISQNSGDLSLGISGGSCAYNIVSGNLMMGNSYSGIWLNSFCRNNIFYGNYIANHGYTPYESDHYSGSGIAFGGASTTAVDNTFYNNVFTNNSRNFEFYNEPSSPGNSWDNGTYGNYWSDYNGTDKNNDGIGDKGYMLESLNWDNHPLTGRAL